MTEAPSKRKPLIHALYASPLSGPEVEAESFKIIDREAPGHSFSPEEWQVVRRMVHTAGDFSILETVRFSPDAISSAIAALREGAPIFADSNMIRSGLSLERLQAASRHYTKDSIFSHVADADIARQAREAGLPRSLFAVRKAEAVINGGIAVFGNAPVALLELNRMIIEDGIRPALVVAMPVGFVHVTESKEELMGLDVPYICLKGRRGGSPLAVSVIHALCSLASQAGTNQP
jgi:precorrin isomerase